MQYANILLALGGDTGTTVPKDEVSASEIAVLRLIHGEAAVTEVEPVKVDEAKAKRTSREEINRLKELYGRARVQSEDGTEVPVIQALFPGAAAQAIKSLDDLDIPKEFYKAKGRVTAPADDEASNEGDGLDKKSKTELLEEAERRGVEVASNATKANIIEAIRAADSDEGNDTDEVFA